MDEEAEEEGGGAIAPLVSCLVDAVAPKAPVVVVFVFVVVCGGAPLPREERALSDRVVREIGMDWTSNELCTNTHTHTHACMCTHTHTHACAHTHTHTQKCSHWQITRH